MSAAAAQAPELAIDTQLLGVILFMTETLAQHPKASNTGQISSFLQQAAGPSGQEVNQGLAAEISLLHSLLSNNQQQPATAASFVNAEGKTHSPTPMKSVGLIGLSPEDIEAVTVWHFCYVAVLLGVPLLYLLGHSCSCCFQVL